MKSTMLFFSPSFLGNVTKSLRITQILVKIKIKTFYTQILSTSAHLVSKMNVLFLFTD